MLTVHTEGRGVCGVYTKDIAATKVDQVLDMARGFTSTLQCVMEEKRMIAQELEVSLHMAFMDARQNAMSSSALNTCCWPCSTTPLPPMCCAPALNLDQLRKNLSEFIEQHTPLVSGTDEVETSLRWASSA